MREAKEIADPLYFNPDWLEISIHHMTLFAEAMIVMRKSPGHYIGKGRLCQANG